MVQFNSELIRGTVPHTESLPDELEEQQEKQMAQFDSKLIRDTVPHTESSPDELETQLKNNAKTNDHNRGQTFKNHVNIVALIGLWCVVAAVILCGLFYLYHMLSPECWHFLNDNQLEQIRTFVVTAILSSSLTNYANRHINEE